MANLRVVAVNGADSRTIKAKFTDKLHPSIGKDNVVVTAVLDGIPAPQVVSVSVRDDVLIAKVHPMTPFVKYRVEFKSTDTVRFKNLTGNSYLFEDGKTNIVGFVGPENPTNPVRDVFVSFLKDNIYNLNRGTLVRLILNQLSEDLNRLRYDTKQTKTDNYLEVLISNERKVRGYGPWDRLNEEGAFEIVRVGTTEENATIPGSISFDVFPSDPITLQRVAISNEQLTAGTSAGTFNQLVLNMTHYPVTKLTSVTIRYQNGTTYIYDIRTLGYQIKDPKYDTDYASTLVTLEENQFQLNQEILDDPTFVRPGAGDVVVVSYEYKSLGKIIAEDSVTVTQVLDAVRLPAPPLTNEFSLENAPVVNSADAIPTRNGIQFLDPRSETPFLTTHPAFTREIPYREGALPAFPGEYAVDYENGRVFVYGAVTNDGTGSFPPAMTYKYRYSFRADLDYTYDHDTYQVVSSPLRDLTGQQAKISFNYEQTLVPGVDFGGQVHVESVNERIGNNLVGTNAIRPAHYPVTNVFRIFNETTGEIYQLTRFNQSTIYFSSKTPPRIADATRERASFEYVTNETLIQESESTNVLGTKVFKIRLLNDNIMSNTEDLIGSSFNSSVVFSRNDVFSRELYYDAQVLSEAQNTSRLSVGDYQINYRDGIIYVGVSASQSLDVGTASYRKPVISPKNPHVLSVSEVYYSITELLGIAKRLDYSSFDDGEIVPNIFDVSDERFLNGDTSMPYTIYNRQITVTDDIKTVRGIYDVYDLNNNAEPTNFAPASTFSANIITLNTTGIEKNAVVTVGPGLTVTVPTISPGIVLSLAKSVVRLSDSVELLDGYQNISNNTITLSAASGAVVGDIVDVLYTVVMNSGATPVVDYDRGGYYVDYTYLLDEILITYEYGDNVVDFRESDYFKPGTEYFVTYKIGALRDALLKNFGTLVDIPELNVFDEELDREIYRDILQGALQSYTKGPTLPAMTLLVSSVTHIDPRIIEAAFRVWSLGISYLQPWSFIVQGNPELATGVFDYGILPRYSGDAVTFPVSSNLRLEEGTMEMWVIPLWDGLDNDATLTFSSLTRDGYAMTASDIYIGASSFHPTLEDGVFTVNRLDTPSPIGLPSAIFTSTGLFVYYDEDNKRWKVLAKERVDVPLPPDGYVFAGNIQSSGDVYDVKFIPGLGEITDVLRSGNTQIDFEFHLDAKDKLSPDGYSTNDGYVVGHSFDGITFMADNEHYFFDFGDAEDKNRFSLYKDGRGYISFEVWDKGEVGVQKPGSRNSYVVSADIQDWKAGERHHLAISWILNSSDQRDEMHLYIDGLEVPNIIRYGGIPAAVSSDRFRTVVPEVVAGTVPLKTIAGNDLATTAGSNVVTSTTTNFQSEGILPGHTIEIQEQGFTTYTINVVNGFQLTLSSNMPTTLPDARYSINPFSAIVETELDVYRNLAVYRLSGGVEEELPGERALVPAYKAETNALNQNILTILGDAEAGDQILIRTLGLNHRRCRDTVYIWGNNQSILKTHLPPPIDLDATNIYSVPLPLTIVGPDNATLIAGNWVASLTATEVSNSTEGRRLDVRVTGGNVNFSTATTVTINGTSTGGPVEVLSYSAAGIQTTAYKWRTITSIDVVTKPLITTIDGVGVEIRETYSLTEPDGNNSYPVIRYAYQTQAGVTLEGTGNDIVTDPNGFFPASDVGNLLEITYPPSVAGVYQIAEKIDNTTVRLDVATGTAFVDGRYGTFNISIGRSGFQNGFFFLEAAGFTNDPYYIPRGYYDFDFAAWLEVPFDPVNQTAYIGSDLNGEKQAMAVIDEFRILNLQLTDTRVGETVGVGDDSITIDANAIRPFQKNADTLVLLHFDSLPVENDADYYRFAQREYIQAGSSVNSRFGHSIVIKDKGLTFDNKNRLTTRDEGTIEFWVSPMYDTFNDPVPRVYFDAASSVVEEVTSLTKGTVKISGRTNRVLSVRLATDTTNTGTEYFAGGTISSDFMTLNLNVPLPFQNTPVKVSYVPSGLQNDRMTILKDTEGFISFVVSASGQEIKVRQPVFWPRDSWHRIRASWKFNRADNRDEIRLFVDGEERGVILFGAGLLFGEGYVWGQNTVSVGNQILVTDINFLDPITQFHIGMDFTGSRGAHARMDNFKLSDISLQPVTIGGQPRDVYYNTNTELIFPTIEDAFTTFLMNFDRLVEKTEDFAILRDPSYGIFNFEIDIIDSFDIVLSDPRVQQVLEAMIYDLKPANSKVDIIYIQ